MAESGGTGAAVTGRQRYKLTVEYDGSSYHGSQRQKDRRSVQEDLEAALAKLCPRGPAPIAVFSGRTDAGVHALSNVAHVDIERTDKHGAPMAPMEEKALLNALNHHLGERIGVASAIGLQAAVGLHAVK